MKTSASILVVDDQPDLAENIQMTLEAAGHQVLTASDGVEALTVLQSQPVDLILAGIAMPGMNGCQLYERVRENPQWLAIPFIFLTARKLDSDIRYGKELGIDDYLTKPIQPEDLLATVHGRLRRVQQLAQSVPPAATAPQTEPSLLRAGRIRISSDQHRARLDEEELKLSAREFTLLEYLAKNASKILSAEELIKVTHHLDTDHIEAGSLLGPLLHSLRRKLGVAVGETGLIENVRGVGYRLILPDD